MELTPHNRGRLLVLAAAVMWSLSGVFVKSPVLSSMPAEIAGPAIAFYRALFAALVLLPIAKPSKLRWHPAILVMVLCFATMNLLLIWSMTKTTAANAILLQYTAPMWMFLASVTLLKEKADRGNLVALALGMVGIGVIVWTFREGTEAIGVAMGLGAGVAYGGVVVCLRILKDHDPGNLTIINHAVSAAVLLPWVLSAGAFPGAPAMITLLAFGLLQMAVPYVVFARGLRTVSPQEAGVIALLEPIINPLWVFLLWGEPVHRATFVGGAFILAGLVFRYLPRTGKRV